MLSLLADRVVIVVSRGRRDTPIEGIAGVVVADDEAVRGIGAKAWHAAIAWPDKTAETEAAEAEWRDLAEADDDEDWEEAGDA